MAVMVPEPTDILVLERRIARDDLVRLELHADAEQVLLEQGSHQTDLWGGKLLSWARAGRLHRIHLADQHPTGQGQPWHGGRGPGGQRAHPGPYVHAHPGRRASLR